MSLRCWALSIFAARERLDNLVIIVNCNLQRLDGPVRGNGKIIQELERAFRGADWQVLKVIWGSGWDALLASDHEGRIAPSYGGVSRRGLSALLHSAWRRAARALGSR
jgi:pyruvate dehydrogenase complex dehydrogenase (E1) component